MRGGLIFPPMNSANPRDAWFSPWLLAGLIALLILIGYPEVILGGHSFFNGDFGTFTYPTTFFHRASLLRGEVPLWNPLNNCGIPFLAQWNTAVLYPPTLFYVLLPFPWSLNIFCLAHLFIAGLGMYFLAVRWFDNRFAATFAGLIFAWNGLSIQSLVWVSNLAALTWMPFVILFVERAWQQGGRRLIPAALVAAVQLLAGAPEFILMTWLILGMLALAQGYRKTVSWSAIIRRLTVIVAVTAALGAAQILPFLDFIAHSDRSADVSNNRWALPAWGWANLIVPLFHCTPSQLGVYSLDEQQWTSSIYLGIATVALALLALGRIRQPRVLILIGIAAAGLLLAMGQSNPVYALLKSVFPQLGLMRYPIKLIGLAAFALPLLAAVSLARLPSEPASGRRWIPVGAFLLVLTGGILFVAHRWPHPDESWAVTWHNAALRVVFLLLIGAAFCWMDRAQSTRAQVALGCLALLLAGIDQVTHTPKQNPTVSTRAFADLGIRDEVTARPGTARAMIRPLTSAFLSSSASPDPLLSYTGYRRTLFMDCNLLEGIPVVQGFFSLYLKEQSAIYYRLYYDVTNAFPRPLADFLGASQISTSEQLFGWVTRTNFMPLITAGQRPVYATPTNTFLAVTSLEFTPRTEVYLPPEAAWVIHATNGSAAQVTLRDFSARQLSFEANALQPSLAVIAQTYYHPWHAYVDGQPVRLWRANHAFQALEIPAGLHTVKLVYEDRAFQAGAVISLLALAGCLVGLGRRFKSPAA